jgi:hypothetical protein
MDTYRDIPFRVVQTTYEDLGNYSRVNDARLREIQVGLIKLYGTYGPTNYDLMAMCGWIMYQLRAAGVPPELLLNVLAYQMNAIEADERERATRMQS